MFSKIGKTARILRASSPTLALPSLRAGPPRRRCPAVCVGQHVPARETDTIRLPTSRQLNRERRERRKEGPRAPAQLRSAGAGTWGDRPCGRDGWGRAERPGAAAPPQLDGDAASAGPRRRKMEKDQRAGGRRSQQRVLETEGDLGLPREFGDRPGDPSGTLPTGPPP